MLFYLGGKETQSLDWIVASISWFYSVPSLLLIKMLKTRDSFHISAILILVGCYSQLVTQMTWIGMDLVLYIQNCDETHLERK
jgi:hypothetical protein